MQAGVSAEDFEKNKESLHDSASKMAESRLKSKIVLDLIADKEKIKVENDDLESCRYAPSIDDWSKA